MTEINTLLELRTRIKEKKPDFIRQDNPKRMKVNDKWRKPKGIHSKIRHKFKGRRKMPSPGYKSPREAKGLHSSGLKIVGILSINDLIKIRKESEGAVIAKSVGMKKKLEILKKARELNVNILNLNVNEQIKKIEDFINSKKKKATTEVKKEEVKKEKAVTKEPIEKTQVSDKDDKKLAEKKEKDKVLTKRT
ncbi:50S ribosomal protein L32e [Candidatus Woesearchaeota archaeon]|nr:50S ribosomal protein L32e [Candidatus Woesearchaeota archaeon]